MLAARVRRDYQSQEAVMTGRRFLLLAWLCFAAGTIAPLAAAVAAECADFVSTGADDQPGIGELVGTIEETDHYTSGHVSGPPKRRTYGVYAMDNGRRVVLDCDTYAPRSAA
jgi:hypothetical protein